MTLCMQYLSSESSVLYCEWEQYISSVISGSSVCSDSSGSSESSLCGGVTSISDGILHLFLRLCPCLLHLQWSPQPLFDIRPLPLILFRLERFQSKIQILLRTNPPFTATTTALQTSCILRAWCLSFCKTPWKCTIQGKEGPLTLFCPLESIYQPWLLPQPSF